MCIRDRWDPVFSLSIKFVGKMCDIDQVMSQNVNFNMAAAAILDLAGYQVCQ